MLLVLTRKIPRIAVYETEKNRRDADLELPANRHYECCIEWRKIVM
jgi:hypothetical protein